MVEYFNRQTGFCYPIFSSSYSQITTVVTFSALNGLYLFFLVLTTGMN